MRLKKRERNRRGNSVRRRQPAIEQLETRRLLTTYVVDSPFDGTRMDGHLSLREALYAANENQVFNEAPAGTEGRGEGRDIITFAPSLKGRPLTFGGLVITDAVEIRGFPSRPDSSSEPPIVFQGNGRARLFQLVERSAETVISDVVITGGVRNRGGAISVGKGAEIEMHRVLIRNNRSFQDGGAIAVDAGGDLSLIDSVVRDNSAGGDGGAAVVEGFMAVHGGQLTGNKAAGDGGAVAIGGRGVSVWTEVEASLNQAEHDGGALSVSADGTVGWVDVVASQNVAAAGGAVSIEGGQWDADGSRMVSNRATSPTGSGGGAVLNTGGTASIRTSEVSENESASRGGGIAVYASDFAGPQPPGKAAGISVTETTLGNNRSDAAGGGISVSGIDAVFSSVTLSGNRSGSGGALAVDSKSSHRNHVQLFSSIVSDNAPAGGMDISGRFESLGHNLLGRLEQESFAALVASDLVTADPRLAPLDDYNADTIRVFALLADSPAIGAGSSTHSSGDIGAFDSQLTAPVTLDPATLSVGDGLPRQVGDGQPDRITIGPGQSPNRITVTVNDLPLGERALPRDRKLRVGGNTDSTVLRIQAGVTIELASTDESNGNSDRQPRVQVRFHETSDEPTSRTLQLDPAGIENLEVETSAASVVRIGNFTQPSGLEITLDSFTTARGLNGLTVIDFEDADRQIVIRDTPVQVTNGTVTPLLQRPGIATDVNGDGHITALDALLVINFLNKNLNASRLDDLTRELGAGVGVWLDQQSRIDVNGDDSITALDALRVINALNEIESLSEKVG